MSAFYKFLYQVYKLPWVVTRPITLSICLLLLKEDQLLLVKPTYMNGWYLLGGGVKRNESLEQAARREAREEIGGELGRLELAGLYARFHDFKSDHIALFRCSDFTYTGKHDFEIEQIAFFPVDRLPADLDPSQRRKIQETLSDVESNLHLGYW